MVVSAMGAIVSVCYCFIGAGTAGYYPMEPRNSVSYSLGPGDTPTGLMFDMFNSLTSVMFAFGGHNIALVSSCSL